MRKAGEEAAYPVSQVNRYIKNMFLSDAVLNGIWVKGEVSNCKYHSSGHIYFTLKDETSQMACVMFSGDRAGLAFRLTEGLGVIVAGSVSVYERDGRYQLYAKRIKKDGAGSLYEQLEALKQRLSEEGLFAAAYKKPIPAYAKTVGIVTAKTGAAVRDIINISRRRNPYISLLLCPAQVQGEGAAASVVRGIQRLDALKPDVIIVGRGGGAIEDLWAFNEEAVVRAVFECETPIISAVGHEIDTTLADYAADLRAPTPSAAAELAVSDIREFYAQLRGAGQVMNRIMEQKLLRYRNGLESLTLRLSHARTENRILQKRQFLLEKEEALSRTMKDRLTGARHSLELYIERMKGLSPLERLGRGYFYAADEAGRMVKSVNGISPGTRLVFSGADGELHTRVETVYSLDPERFLKAEKEKKVMERAGEEKDG